MNRKQLTILLVLVVVLGVAGWLVRQRDRSAFQGAGRNTSQKVLGSFPYNDVAHVAIKQGANEVNLVKREGLWRVRERYDYPANFTELREFLLKADDLKAIQSEKAGPSQLSRLELAPGQTTNPPVLVDFKDQNEKSIRTLLLGKKHLKKTNNPSPMGDGGDEGYPEGRWVRAGTDNDTVALISDSLDTIVPKPEQWLSKDFFKVEKLKSISVTYAAETNSFKVSRDTEVANWKLADAKPTEQLDSAKTSGFAYALSSPSFTDVLPTDAKPEQTGLDKPTLVVLESFDNFTYTLKLGAKTNDNYTMALAVAASLPKERVAGKDEKPEDKARLDKEFADSQKKIQDKLAQEKSCEKWIYLVSSYTLEPVLKERGQLLAEKKPEPEPGKEEGSSTNAVDLIKLPDPAPKAGETNATAP